MQVNGPAHLHGAQSVNAPHSLRRAENTQAPTQATGGDEISISQEAELMSRIQEMPEVRQERVDQIRSEIAEGIYETEEKLDIAVARLLDEIA